jgi:hypothetical protein
MWGFFGSMGLVAAKKGICFRCKSWDVAIPIDAGSESLTQTPKNHMGIISSWEELSNVQELQQRQLS